MCQKGRVKFSTTELSLLVLLSNCLNPKLDSKDHVTILSLCVLLTFWLLVYNEKLHSEFTEGIKNHWNICIRTTNISSVING